VRRHWHSWSALALVVTSLVASGPAQAWLFIFVPGSVTRGIRDAITGSEGENCVGTSAKVGDVLTSPTGNTAIVKSLSGTSSICQDPHLPIRARLEFKYSFSSKAGIELPNTFKAREITSFQRYNGMLLNVIDERKRMGVVVTAVPRAPGTDGGVWAKNIASRMLASVDGGKTSNEEELTINAMHAYRFQLEGKNKGMFGRSYTYVVTVLEGPKELIAVNANGPTGDFEAEKETLRGFAFQVKGLDAAEVQATPSTSSVVPTAAGGDSLPGESKTSADAPNASAPKVAQPTGSGSVATGPGAIPAQSANGADSANHGSSASEGGEIAKKLRELEALRKEGLISQSEFDAKRAELLKQL